MTRRTSQRRLRGPKASAVRTAVVGWRADGTLRWWRAVAVVVAVLVVVLGLYTIYHTSNSTPPARTAGGGSGYPYQVGSPGPGQLAPTFRLAASTGGQLDLATLRGKTVLLYFQEGLTCQPCWDQIADLETNTAAVKAAGIDQIISITTDPVDLIARKVHDMRLSTVVLSDPDLAVSGAYHANQYGMMGTARDGHSFILVAPDGSIRWRADYGGAPRYTMFVPTAALLADLRAATVASSTAASSTGASP